MRTSQIQALLESVYPVRAEIIPCLLGDPGIGKTQAIHQFAKNHGVNVVTFILSHTLPSEVSGIRMPDLEHDELRVLDDAKMSSLKDGDILFFDELLEAPQQLWSAVLTLLQDRVMASGKKLPDVMIVAASNKTATAKQIPASTRDRFMWVDLDFDFGAWSKWFNDTHGVTPVNAAKDLMFKDNGYNIMTPRKFTKLYDWCDANDWSQETTNYVRSIFGGLLLDKLIATHMNISEKQQLLDACINIEGIEMPLNADLMTVEEIAQYLMGLPEWDRIAEELKNISVKEETCMF
jgi:hypothetical protein